MQYRTTLFLFLLAAALVTFIVAVERHSETTDEQWDREIGGQLLKVQWHDVTRIEITRGAAITELTRRSEPGQWDVTRPLKAPAAVRAATEIPERLSRFRVHTKVKHPPGGYDLAAYGLQPPVLTLRADHGGATTVVEFGAKMPVGEDRYVRVSGDPGVYLTDAVLFKALDRPASAFMERRVFDFGDDEPGRLVLEQSAAEGADARRVELSIEDDVWTIDAPRSLAVDRDETLRTLAALKALEAIDVLDAAQVDLATAGLEPPRGVVLAEVAKPSKSIRLEIGAPVADRPELRYARRAGETAVLLLSANALLPFAPELQRLRSKVYFDIPDRPIERVEVNSPAGRVIVAKQGDAWVAEQPAGVPVDYSSVHNYLTRIRVWTVQQFVADAVPAELPRFGLDQPRLTLSLLVRHPNEETPRSLKYCIGWREDDPENVFGLTSDGREVVRLDTSAKDLFARGVLCFRQLALLSFHRSRLVDFTVERVLPAVPGSSAALVRRQSVTHPSGDPESWQVAEGDHVQSVDDAVIDPLVDQLTEVWAVDAVADRPPALAPFGLDPAEITVTFHYRDSDAADAPVREDVLRLGRAGPHRTRYASLDSAHLVFTWTEETARTFERDLTLPAEPEMGEPHDHQGTPHVPPLDGGAGGEHDPDPEK